MKFLFNCISKRAVWWSRLFLAGVVISLLGACAAPAPYDYTAFKQSRPASLLVLPPVNESPDVMATYGVLAQVSQPLAEAGYYVVPVSLMAETFKQNGMTSPSDIHEISFKKLHEIFGADAAVYMRVKKYGTSYMVINSETVVALEARIVDLRNGALLWQGQAQASSAEQNNNSQGGLVGLLVTAMVKQIMGNVTDAAFTYAGTANQRLLGAGTQNGVLPGPRSPLYMKN